MANIKFSAFTQKVALADVDFLVGYTGADNVRVAPSVLSSVYLPLAGGTMTGDLLVTTTGGYFQVDVSDNSVKFADNTTAKFGTSNDLKIYHDGNDSYIDDSGTGDLRIRSNFLKIEKYTGETMATFNDDNAVSLYYDNTKRFETSAGGVLVTGTLDATGTISVTGASSNIKVGTDTGKFMAGASNDLQLYHDGSNSYIQNEVGNLTIFNKQDDGDIIFASDNGSGGTATYFYLDGSSVTTVVSKEFKFEDNVKANFGTGVDLQIYHNAADSVIENNTGDLYITNKADDKDIIFRSDDGAGSYETYFYLDGSAGSTDPATRFPDNSYLKFGDAQDFSFVHTGTSYIQNFTGDLQINQYADDADMIFKSDDGAGGITTYFYLDGSIVENRFTKATRHSDNIIAKFGDANDLNIYSNGSNSYIENFNNDLVISNTADDKDIKFFCDDGSGGVTPYITLDGSHTTTLIQKKMHFDDNIKLTFGDYATPDLEIYHDGSDSYISDTGTGDLRLLSSLIRLRTESGENMLRAETNAGVYLYYDNVVKFETSSTGTTTTGQMNIAALNTAPASASAAGTLGEIRYTADYIYVCTATNTWKRSALSTW